MEYDDDHIFSHSPTDTESLATELASDEQFLRRIREGASVEEVLADIISDSSLKLYEQSSAILANMN